MVYTCIGNRLRGEFSSTGKLISAGAGTRQSIATQIVKSGFSWNIFALEARKRRLGTEPKLANGKCTGVAVASPVVFISRAAAPRRQTFVAVDLASIIIIIVIIINATFLRCPSNRARGRTRRRAA